MLVAITPTGGRPYQFKLAEKYMRRQTLQPDMWLIIDDCDPATAVTMGQTILRPYPRWSPQSGNTQFRNWLAALDYLPAHLGRQLRIICWEDDDWYAPEYIEQQEAKLKTYDLVGESPSRYWHVKHQCYRVFYDAPNPSLAATAFTGGVIPVLRTILQNEEWIDSTLWSRWRIMKKQYTATSTLGIKGLPGRPGVSAAHRNEPGPGWISDTNGGTLRQWIGEDAAAYLQVEKPEPELQQPDLSCGLRWFRGEGGQIRYRCPSCALDHYDPAEIGIHWTKEHKAIEDPLGVAGTDIFGPADVPIDKKIVVPERW